jgi:hypothetical protein
MGGSNSDQEYVEDLRTAPSTASKEEMEKTVNINGGGLAHMTAGDVPRFFTGRF